MTYPWFRFYVSVLHDPKVQKLDSNTFKTWVNCLCIAATNNGKLPPISDIAFALRMDETATKHLVEELVAAELLDITGETYTPHNWNKRQYVTSTDRVRKHRFTKCSMKQSGGTGETPPDTDTDTETDSEAERTLPQKAPSRRRRSAAPEVPYTPAFEAFWALYPKRVGKLKAALAFPGREAEAVMAGLRRLLPAIQAENGKDGDYRPYPATWLNGRRWEDEPPATTAPAQPRQAMLMREDGL